MVFYLILFHQRGFKSSMNDKYIYIYEIRFNYIILNCIVNIKKIYRDVTFFRKNISQIPLNRMNKYEIKC